MVENLKDHAESIAEITRIVPAIGRRACQTIVILIRSRVVEKITADDNSHFKFCSKKKLLIPVVMLRCLANLFRRSSMPQSALLHRRDFDPTSTRNAQFISFLDDSGFRRIDTDRWERKMRRQRVVAYALLWSMVAGFAWVVIESAQALSIF